MQASRVAMWLCSLFILVPLLLFYLALYRLDLLIAAFLFSMLYRNVLDTCTSISRLCAVVRSSVFFLAPWCRVYGSLAVGTRFVIAVDRADRISHGRRGVLRRGVVGSWLLCCTMKIYHLTNSA